MGIDTIGINNTGINAINIRTPYKQQPQIQTEGSKQTSDGTDKALKDYSKACKNRGLAELQFGTEEGNTANKLARDNGYDGAVLKGKIGNKSYYKPYYLDNDVHYEGLPQYIVSDGSKMIIITDKDFSITDKLEK